MIERISKLTKQMPASFPELKEVLEGLLPVKQDFLVTHRPLFAAGAGVKFQSKGYGFHFDFLLTPTDTPICQVTLDEHGHMESVNVQVSGPEILAAAHDMLLRHKKERKELEQGKTDMTFDKHMKSLPKGKEFIESIRNKQAELRLATEDPLNVSKVDGAVDAVKEYVRKFADNPENCFSSYIKLKWNRKVDGDGTVVYEVFDANNEKNAICTFPKVMIREFDRKLHDAGLAKSASLGDDGHIKLDWSW